MQRSDRRMQNRVRSHRNKPNSSLHRKTNTSTSAYRGASQSGYSLFLRKVSSDAGNDSLTFTQTLTVSAQFNLTKNWKISGSTSYDFINKEFPTANLQIYRDLHCWEMSINWVPFGIRQGYYFVLRVKASVLQDLKIPKRQDWNAY
jgi:lipopolysaccharide assembly outer membrane protein LptD (OstA)